MIRFSLASLFGTTLFVAVGCVALMYANSVWRQGAVTLTVSVLLLATLLAIAKRGRAQVFALGFAVSGWLYLLLAFSPALALCDDLLSENAIAWLFEAIHEEDAWQYYAPVVAGSRRIWSVSAVGIDDGTKFRDFADFGHALWTLIVGGVGGLTASILWARQQRAPQEDAGQQVISPEDRRKSISSRPPEGDPNQCPVCGHSRPLGGARCPHCGCLVWFATSDTADHTAIVVDVVRLLGVDDGQGDIRTVDDLTAPFPVLVVTFREVDYLSCAAIGSLLQLYKQVTMKSRRLLFIVPPEKTAIREIFELTRLDSLLDICDSDQEVLDRIRA